MSSGDRSGFRGFTDLGALRTANAMWNAAGAYGFDVPWWAEGVHGDERGLPARAAGLDADAACPVFDASRLYAATATGLICKWFGSQRVGALCQAWAEDVRARLLDRAAWFAFESAAFACERGERPALGELRRAFWGSLSDEDRLLAADLDCTGLSFDGVCGRLRAVLLARYGFDGRVIRPAQRMLHLGVSFLALAERVRRKGLPLQATDAPTPPSPGERAGKASPDAAERSGGREPKNGSLARWGESREQRTAAWARDCFGSLLCTNGELAQLEGELCTGIHRACRLWVCSGSTPPGGTRSHGARLMLAAALAQGERNRALFRERHAEREAVARRLAQCLRDRLHARPDAVVRRLRNGTLDAAAAWRAGVLGDGRVFCRKSAGEDCDLSVDLLLDASSSRSDQQEEVALQAWVVASALARCGIAVRIASFCSMRGFTVLRYFNDYDTPADIANVTNYYAVGMNRDGLALRAVGARMRGGKAAVKLLLVLTDAAPMDDQPAAPQAGEAFGHDYADALAVGDTARAVRELARDGIKVAAIHSGSDSSVKNAQVMYGAATVRVRRVAQMAESVAGLVATAVGA